MKSNRSFLWLWDKHNCFRQGKHSSKVNWRDSKWTFIHPIRIDGTTLVGTVPEAENRAGSLREPLPLRRSAVWWRDWLINRQLQSSEAVEIQNASPGEVGGGECIVQILYSMREKLVFLVHPSVASDLNRTWFTVDIW